MTQFSTHKKCIQNSFAHNGGVSRGSYVAGGCWQFSALQQKNTRKKRLKSNFVAIFDIGATIRIGPDIQCLQCLHDTDPMWFKLTSLCFRTSQIGIARLVLKLQQCKMVD